MAVNRLGIHVLRRNGREEHDVHSSITGGCSRIGSMRPAPDGKMGSGFVGSGPSGMMGGMWLGEGEGEGGTEEALISGN
jgi:hypothetical protein